MEKNDVNIEKTEKQPRKTNTIPVKQADILNLAEVVSNKWEATPAITLQWINVAEFKKVIIEFKNSLEQRIQVGSGRQSKTKMLKNLDTALNKAVEAIKIAVLGVFGKEDGKSYFSEFGIVKTNKTFKLPSDRNQRQQALETLIKGIEKHNLAVVKYPIDFFRDTQKQYQLLLQETQTIDSTVASEVSNKNESIKQVEKVLNALIYIIKGNYPDTYKGELRAWGFQKEKY
jgi:hypothetical protein